MQRTPCCILVLAGVSLALLAVATPQTSPLAPLDFDRGASGLGLALRRVGASGRVLYVTAHPDDEHSGVLVRLSRGLGLRTALLTVTRGEGGQNAIGPELFEALGVLRTAELSAVHRFDGVEQYFGRAYEFGYSFSVEETLARWGHDETLSDIVRVVRAFRPDVILTMPLEGAGGGQHHQAVGRLTREAFRVAADPARFSEQLREGLLPWQARKIYVGGVGGFPVPLPGVPVQVPTGTYDPLLGMTWQQIGSRARAMHRCQGVSQLVADPGPAEGVYSFVDAELRPLAPERDILDGIDTSLVGIALFSPTADVIGPALADLQGKALAARAAFDPTSPEAAVVPLVETLVALRALRRPVEERLEDASRFEVLDRLAEEEADVLKALVLAQGLVIETRSSDGLVTPGQRFEEILSIWNQGHSPVVLEQAVLDAPPEWIVERHEGEAGEIAPGESRRLRFAVAVPDAAPVSQPYWRRRSDRDRYDLLVPADETLPWSPPKLMARVRCRVAGAEVALHTPAIFRYGGTPDAGERRHPVEVVPELALQVSPEIVPLPTGSRRQSIDMRVAVRSEIRGEADATIRLEVPPGWAVHPSSVPLRFAYEGEELATRFTVTPPPVVAPGQHLLRAVAEHRAREHRQTVQVVDYPHIERHQLVRPAEARVVALDLRTSPAVDVGYVSGSGDAIAEAIRALGVPLTQLSAEDLAFGDLSRFTTIVTGIRAYETRPDLRAYHNRLMRWVEAGGHVVVQYNRDPFNRSTPGPSLGASPSTSSSPFAPYPALVTPERITDETTPLRILAPDHPLLTTPNRIGPRDWQEWVQERGIQLLATRDPHYTDLLAATDPFPYNSGEKRGLLVDAGVGAGSWTYVGLVLFRQVPAGVPGGWRLLANLVSRPRARPMRAGGGR